mmetsp:Transcript_9695/g.23678  ORF Transcript_9695/g.23678 Transcript_9695/m.23678 type:complete len:213 (+) Transcript_9695:52-690(+)
MLRGLFRWPDAAQNLICEEATHDIPGVAGVGIPRVQIAIDAALHLTTRVTYDQRCAWLEPLVAVHKCAVQWDPLSRRPRGRRLVGQHAGAERRQRRRTGTSAVVGFQEASRRVCGVVELPHPRTTSVRLSSRKHTRQHSLLHSVLPILERDGPLPVAVALRPFVPIVIEGVLGAMEVAVVRAQESMGIEVSRAESLLSPLIGQRVVDGRLQN